MKNTTFVLTTLLAVGLMSPLAHAVEYKVQATMASNLNGGPDPRQLEGFSSTIIVKIPSTATPISHTATTATYSLAAGSMRMNSNEGTGQHIYISNGTGQLTISVPTAGANTISVQAPFTFQGKAFTISYKASLSNGSFSSRALMHPTKFTPTQQTISSPASYLIYTLGGTTKLGMAGDAAN